MVQGRARGPGDYLHDAILFWTREKTTAKCGCEDRIRKMNQWGAACNDHVDEIAAWMIEQAKERGWKLAKASGAATIAKLMVKRAIRQWERANESQASDSR